MKASKLFLVTILTTTTIVAAVKLSSVLLIVQKSGPSAHDERALLKGFAEIQPIDVHTHIYKDDPELNGLIERLNLRAVNICVIDDRDPDFKGLEPQRTEVLKVRQSTLGRVAFCTTFSPYAFEEPGFSARVIRQLNGDFAQGAVAVKIYKVMGMEMKSKAGSWVMADDPAFRAHLSRYRITQSHADSALSRTGLLLETTQSRQPRLLLLQGASGRIRLHASRMAIKGGDPCGARSSAGRESQAARHRRTPR